MFCFRDPSVQRIGYTAYFAQMAELQRQNSDLILLPGLEVSPYAWWSGFPPFLHDWDVHFTVYNLEDPGVLKEMPIPGDRYAGCCSYERGRGLRRYQDFVSYVTGAGGLVFQAHPESVTTHKKPAAVSKTQPHPEYAASLEGLTGFAALPAGREKLLEPGGGGWDSALSEYLDRKRVHPLWTLGDSDFHGAEQQLDAVVTWIYAQCVDKAALVHAMARGRMVAVQGGGFPCLRVEEFALAAPGHQAGRVMCGETLRDPKATTVRFALSRPVPGLSVRLIRNGEVIFTTREGSFAFSDSAFLAGHRRAYYREEATGDGGIEVVTNPVFREE